MRTSSYNIYIKLPEEDSYIIIQGYTGAVDCISDSVYKYLMNKDSNKDKHISKETVETLKRRGYLTERSFTQERGHLKQVARIIHEQDIHEMNVLFMPTFSCQLRCVYCYEASISQREDDFSQAVMTNAHIQSAYDTIDWIAENYNKEQPQSIDLFGGEPLQAKNYDIVRQIVEEGMRRKIRKFGAITNGYDLLEYENLLGKDKLANLQITIDGPEYIHNKRRIGKEGQPTFKKIVDGIQLALDKGCNVSIRTNVDKSNIDSLPMLNQFYIDKGWNRYSNFHSHASPVHDWLKNEVIQPIDLLNVADHIDTEKRKDNIIGTDLGIGRCFEALLAPGKFPFLRPQYCGANIGMYIFGPDGYIYTCWNQVGFKNGRIGQYIPKPVLDKNIMIEWLDRNVANIPECANCPYALICGGGCPSMAKKTTGSMLHSSCYQFQNLFHRIVPKIYDAYIKK